MFGLLYLDLYNRDWNLIDETNGLNDSAIWDMLEYDGSIFVATANGVNEVSIVNNSIVLSEGLSYSKDIRTSTNINIIQSINKGFYLIGSFNKI